MNRLLQIFKGIKALASRASRERRSFIGRKNELASTIEATTYNFPPNSLNKYLLDKYSRCARMAALLSPQFRAQLFPFLLNG